MFRSVRVNHVYQNASPVSFTNGADLSMGSGSQVLLDDGTSDNPSLTFASDTNLGLMRFSADRMEVRGAIGVALSDFSGLFGFNIALGGMVVGVGSVIAFSAGDTTTGVQDAIIRRDGTGVLAQRSGVTAQAFRVYGTFTDASNYERASLKTTAGASVELAAETAGTGADNLDVILTPTGTGKVILSTVPRFNGTNSTGAGMALLGANCPASTLAAPYTWITVITSDGSTGYMPIWK